MSTDLNRTQVKQMLILKKIIAFLFFTFFIPLIFIPLTASQHLDEQFKSEGFMDLNIYPYDSHDFTGMTTNIFAKLLD